MSYNRAFRNTVSQPGRYNNSGQFVSAGELGQQSSTPGRTTRATAAACNTNYASLYPSGATAAPPPPSTPAPAPQPTSVAPQQYQPEQLPPPPLLKAEVMEQETSPESEEVAPKTKPSWMKDRGSGVKKISNKERRRRQNEHLRKLLTPKNALMVLNEMMAGDTTPNNFTVEPAPLQAAYYDQSGHKFCAAFSLEGNVYKGFGENKITARNAAAEQAIRDLVIKRMKAAALAGTEGMDTSNGEVSVNTEEEPLPMIQLASYALHKLFTEWQYEGFNVPLLQKPQPQPAGSTSDTESVLTTSKRKQPKKPKEKTLPADAAMMHPCMLLTNMRQGLVYHELGVEGDRPQNQIFTMGVTVDGTTYVGKAPNKKEARKQAAKSACQDIFNIQFVDNIQ